MAMNGGRRGGGGAGAGREKGGRKRTGKVQRGEGGRDGEEGNGFPAFSLLPCPSPSDSPPPSPPLPSPPLPPPYREAEICKRLAARRLDITQAHVREGYDAHRRGDLRTL